MRTSWRLPGRTAGAGAAAMRQCDQPGAGGVAGGAVGTGRGTARRGRAPNRAELGDRPDGGARDGAGLFEAEEVFEEDPLSSWGRPQARRLRSRCQSRSCAVSLTAYPSDSGLNQVGD